jgi:creatinine amidohydrolase
MRLVLFSTLASAALVAGLSVATPNDPPPPRAIALADLAWPDIRAAINAGYTKVIVPTGGTEQNGPHMALDKHNIIVGHAALRIARELGGTLVTPVIPVVPEGDLDQPTGNLLFPGTIGISEAAFEAVLDGVARSLKLSGFKAILFIGDHGQSQSAQARTAARLDAAFAPGGVRVIHVDAYYRDAEQVSALRSAGHTQAAIGDHAGLIDTSELLALSPESIRLQELAGKTPLSRHGASGEPEKATAALGEQLLRIRIDAAVDQIRSALSRGG